MSITNRRAAGFSLVELMVALTIGMVLLAATSSIFVSSKKTYTVNDSLARLQENGRVAMQIISRDIRATGYYGCSDDISSITNVLNNKDAFDFDAETRLESVEFGDPVAGATWTPSTNLVSGFTPLPNTDAIAVRFGKVLGADLDADMNQKSSEMKIDPSTTDINEGDILMLTDCSSADVFQVTDYQNKVSFDHLIHNAGAGTPGNSTGKMSKAYSADAKILKFETNVYYIGTGASGEPSLFRATLAGGGLNPQELVEGIENIQLLYGKDLNSDRIPDVYMTAAEVNNSKTTAADLEVEWSNVVSVRVAILARSLANLDYSSDKAGSQLLDSASYDLNEDGSADYDAGTDTDDKNRQYQRRIFRTTLLMRNLQ